MKFSTFDAFKHISIANGMIEVKDELLSAQQKLLSEMLNDIDSACKAANIDYMLSGGTCLGAIRHEGFIPWDDDMDINMPHSQFPLFQKSLENSFPNKYTVQVPGFTPGYDLAFPRIRLNGTVVRSKEDIGKKRSECGLYVDFFYIENLPNICVLREIHGIISLILGFCYSCRKFADNRENYLDLIKGNSSYSAVFRIKIFVGRLLSFLSPSQWTTIWDKWNSKCNNSNSKYVGIPAGRKHYFKETYKRSSFFPTVQTKFEGISVPIPRDAASYMIALYGPEYMTPPPVEMRETHLVYEFDLGENNPS